VRALTEGLGKVEAVGLGLVAETRYGTTSISGRGGTMVLTATEIANKGIVQGGVGAGVRPTTYDATVGSVVRCGVVVNDMPFVLKPRHIVWVVSTETFDMGDTTTGLATLKTQWTHQGILALNVGVVDPGWNGPLAAAVVNLSNSDFPIAIGDPFFRIIFHEHTSIPANNLKAITVTRQDYVRQIVVHSKSYAKTFLDMDQLSRSVADQVLGLPRWGLILSVFAVVFGLFAISIPVAVAIWTDGHGDKAKIAVLEKQVLDIEKKISPPQIDPARCAREKIAKGFRLICPSS
jgi:dUTPase